MLSHSSHPLPITYHLVLSKPQLPSLPQTITRDGLFSQGLERSCPEDSIPWPSIKGYSGSSHKAKWGEEAAAYSPTGALRACYSQIFPTLFLIPKGPRWPEVLLPVPQFTYCSLCSRQTPGASSTGQNSPELAPLGGGKLGGRSDLAQASLHPSDSASAFPSFSSLQFPAKLFLIFGPYPDARPRPCPSSCPLS